MSLGIFMKKYIRAIIIITLSFVLVACTTNVPPTQPDEVNFAPLTAILVEANELEERNFTPLSWLTFVASRDSAQAVAGNANATQAMVDGAVAGLRAAINGLVARDVAALSAVIEYANALDSEDFSTFGWDAFVSARTNAIGVLANANATQTQVDTAAATLLAAIAILIPIPVTHEALVELLEDLIIVWQLPLSGVCRTNLRQLRSNALALTPTATDEIRYEVYRALWEFMLGVVPRYVEEGYEMAAFARNPEMITIANPNFTGNNDGTNANPPPVNRNHDPSVFFDPVSEYFYVFSTHNLDPVYGPTTGPRARRSKDLIYWETVFIDSLNPNTHAAALAHTNRDSINLWAPDMVRLDDGRYAMFTSLSSFGTPVSAISIVTSDSPTGVFVNPFGEGGNNIVVSSATFGEPNAIDPAFVRDAENRLWMVYGSFFGGIFVMQLNANTGMPINPDQGGTRIAGGAHTAVEGAYIIFNRDLGYFYLFLTYGSLNSEYNVRVARSRSVTGPFLDANGRDVRHTSVGGDLVLTSSNLGGNLGDRVTSFNYVGTKVVGGFDMSLPNQPHTSSNLRAPGHNSAIQAPCGRWFMVKHTRKAPGTAVRGGHIMHVRQMVFNRDGWPLITPFRYAGESLTRVTLDDVVGTYTWVDQGAGIQEAPMRGRLISLNGDFSVSLLNNDGTVYRANAGTFLIVSGVNVELEIDGTRSYGFFMPQWDTRNNRQTMTFSTLTAGSRAAGIAGTGGVSWLGSMEVSG